MLSFKVIYEVKTGKSKSLTNRALELQLRVDFVVPCVYSYVFVSILVLNLLKLWRSLCYFKGIFCFFVVLNSFFSSTKFSTNRTGSAFLHFKFKIMCRRLPNNFKGRGLSIEAVVGQLFFASQPAPLFGLIGWLILF